MKFRLPLLALALAAASAQADVVSDLQPVPVTGLHGATSKDRWTDLTSINHPGYPGFPGSGAWPSPIVSNGSAAGAASLDKAAGNAALLSTSLYFGANSNVVNGFGGSLRVTDATPLAGLKTVVFQLEIGEANGYDLLNRQAPSLTVNGSGVTLNPIGVAVLGRKQNGTFIAPDNTESPVYLTLYGYQYDLSAATGTISSYALNFSGVQHAQVYAMQLDASNVAEAGSVLPAPEPATWALLASGLALGLATLRQKR